MGTIQNTLNNILSTGAKISTTAVALDKLKKSNEAADEANTLKKLDAESGILKREEARNQELAELEKFREDSKIAADTANEKATTLEKEVETMKGVFLPEDREGQALIRQSEEKAKLARGMADAKIKEKLNNYKYIRDRQKYISEQSEIDKERAKVYGIDLGKYKGGKK